MKLRKARVIRKEKSMTLHGPITRNIYPKSPMGEMFERIRHQLEVPISQTAKALGIDPVDVYKVRRGQLTFLNQKAFLQALDLLLKPLEEKQLEDSRKAWKRILKTLETETK